MAQPIPPLITAHLIMKNEADSLPRCLESLRGVVDEICIVDTGSNDESVAVAQSFGAKVVVRPWSDSFSEARNAGLESATGRWILQIDADEELHPEDGERLRQLLLTSDREGYLVDVLSYEGDQRPDCIARHTVLRIWRNRPHYRFRGRIHEGLQMGEQEPGALQPGGIRLLHYGYLTAVHKKKGKSDRNVQLLLKELQNEPESPYWHFYLGTEYMNRREYEEALEHFEIAALRTPIDVAFAPLLVKRRILTVQLLGCHPRALELIDQAVRLFPGLVDLPFLRGESLFRLGRVREALQAFQTCIQMGRKAGSQSEHLGVESYKALWWVGHLQERFGAVNPAVAAYKEALRIAPHFRPACVRLVELLRQRYPIERAVAEVLTADADDHRLLVAGVFFARGDYPAVLQLLAGPAVRRSGAWNCLLGAAYVRTGRTQEGLRILDLAEGEGLREQVQFERVLAAWLSRDYRASGERLAQWRELEQLPSPEPWVPAAAGCARLLLCLAIQAFLEGEPDERIAPPPEQGADDQQEAMVDILRAFYAGGHPEELHSLERFALRRCGAGMAGKVAGLYGESRWSRVWPPATAELIQSLVDATTSGAPLPPEEWVALARLLHRHGRFHEALDCYCQALLLDTCWVSTYLEAAELLHRRAIEVSS